MFFIIISNSHFKIFIQQKLFQDYYFFSKHKLNYKGLKID